MSWVSRRCLLVSWEAGGSTSAKITCLRSLEKTPFALADVLLMGCDLFWFVHLSFLTEIGVREPLCTPCVTQWAPGVGTSLACEEVWNKSSSAPVFVNSKPCIMLWPLWAAVRIAQVAPGARFTLVSSSELYGPSQTSYCHRSGTRVRPNSTKKPLTAGLDCFLPGGLMLLEDAFNPGR